MGTFLVLLLILYYSWYLSILVTIQLLPSALFPVFTNSAFPPHTSLAYYSFGTITLIIIHILILVSKCGSVRIASILPTVVYPFLLLSLCVHPKSSPLRSLRQGTYNLRGGDIGTERGQSTLKRAQRRVQTHVYTDTWYLVLRIIYLVLLYVRNKVQYSMKQHSTTGQGMIPHGTALL